MTPGRPSFYKSTTFRAAMAFGVAGVAHALANLLLARQLPEIQFAYVALFLAFLDFGGVVGTGGADTVVVRYRLTATLALFRRVFASASLMGLLIYLVSTRIYELSTPLALVITVAIIAAACSRVAGSIWQSRHRFRPALIQIQSSHLVLAILGILSLVLGWKSALLICALHAAYLAAIAGFGWRKLAKIDAAATPGTARYPWFECIPIIVITSGVQLAMQTERFLIPHLFRMEDLALYGVLAAVIGSPFQMLSIAVAYTLMPRLRSADSSARRAEVMRYEIVLVISLTLVGAILSLLLGPWIAQLFVGDKFILTTPLILAAILVGLGKVGDAFIVAVVKALGAPTDLNRLSMIGWIGIAVSITAAWPLSNWGLPGMIVGVACGWLVRVLLGAVLARKVFRTKNA